MIITGYAGWELEKAQPNTSEDFFNRSEFTYICNGKEKTFSILYVRYFEEILHEITPFEGKPVFKIEGKDIYLRDIAALAYFLKNPDIYRQKRVYINRIEDFQDIFDESVVGKVQEILVELHEKKQVEIV
ncbi:hypothetical protein ACQVUL_02405 [Bacillus cytotoxicus]|uniref:Uncharacterized protein n=1 Tax=Bacillus cytotoxicus (strain DSM 22905 / CIP 110041 / 391-98 / NVH 391-98) TaxID=315749 RepID=A7GN04_BACCN|nr:MULTISPECIES: hypothetical protein [Bacillus cereus group]ABS21512.1 conserved hypothetical protein [Bacillus cytotoxicus NVH 391-98]AWC44219.1 hypothetical protein CG479_006635 [Bacillus cytotoxicus]MDH2862875.1 hypothetical protein [Bacillus cytotoxicus]MDH2883196.1 hypothetical protein [Bacillus cytotoxicus]NZD31636.1 hypothetical protein [Bacillus cytotoxicus]